MPGDAHSEDRALAARIAAGDPAAFDDLYRAHAARLYNVAWRLLGNGADAEDALQEVFLQAFKKVSSFKGDATLGTWLYRLATNLCLDRLRSRAGRESKRTESIDDLPGSQGPTAVATRDRTLTRLDLERAIAQLPDGARAAFVLHDVEGFDHREVGAILGVSEGTSKSQVHKARMKLRAWLDA
jgi:RNA polymerase sigma-70 factor (ECF subfamily)